MAATPSEENDTVPIEPRKTAPTDWNQWRGPQRTGHVAGFPVPKRWPSQLVRRWSLPLGEGHSSPIVVGDRAYAIVRNGEQEWVHCLALSTGKTVWVDKTPAPFDSVIFPAMRLGKAPRSTPLWDEGRLYTIGVNGLMTCFDAASGKIVWRVDFSKRHKIPFPICGASLSPLIDGRKIYVHVGHEADGEFLALDKTTGRDIWATRFEGPGYTSPVLAKLGGMRQIVTASHNQWVGIDPESGKLLWGLANRQNMFNHNSITPAIAGETIVCGANQRPTFALRVRPAGGKWATEKIWETRDVTMSTSSPIIDGNRVIAVNEKRRGQVVCMALDSGKTLWECPGNKGENVSLFDVGPSVLAFDAGGSMFVYRKNGDALAEVAKYAVADSAVWASPAISGGRILVKGARELTLWELPRA